VILTDFRAIDTLGEITVLALAAAGVVALGRSGRVKPRRAPAAVTVPAPGAGAAGAGEGEG
jgi:hypothetical protein